MKIKKSQLIEEVQKWDSHRVVISKWESAPEAIPRMNDSSSIELRLPSKQVMLLSEFAKRKKCSLGALISYWLDLQISNERDKLKAQQRQIEERCEGIYLANTVEFEPDSCLRPVKLESVQIAS